MSDQTPPSGTVGERIRTLLSERQMSQRQLARALAGDGAATNNVENMRRQISSWVNDQHAPSQENAEALAKQLEVPVEWLIAAPSKRSLSAALDELADLVDVLSRQAETEAARSEDAVRLVRSLDRRLADIEGLLGELLEGQLAGSAALEEILRRWNEVPAVPRDRRGGTSS